MKRKYLIITMVICLTLVSMLVACQDKDSSAMLLALDKDTLELNVGDTYQLKFLDGQEVDMKYVEWSSSNIDVAIVANSDNDKAVGNTSVKSGCVKALSEGTAIIVARYNGKDYYTKVAVIDSNKVAGMQSK